MKNSAIEWTHHTFNPWMGCTKVSAGCLHCYAETLNKRYGRDIWGPGKPRQRTSAINWQQPLAWDRAAILEGARKRVFCASLADVFDQEAPDQWRFDLLTLMQQTHFLNWLILTKRIEHAWSLSDERRYWLGTSCEDQRTFDLRVPVLLERDAHVHFISAEPLLGPIHLRGARLDWVIVGGESGPGARPMSIKWAHNLRDECVAAGIPFFFKQWGGVHKKAAGRILDGELWSEFPVK